MRLRRVPNLLALGVLAAAGCSSPSTTVAPVSSPQPSSTSASTTATSSVTPLPVVAPTPTSAATSTTPVAPTPSSPGVGPPPPVTAATGCHVRGPLPDPACTPGALNPAVTPATIHQTICVSGYTATIRPPVSESTRLKHLSATAYGVTDSISNYEGDHLISLELGGDPDDIANFWDESHATSFAKDDLENHLHSDVCAGRTPLAQAQHEIATDWVSAYCAARLPRCPDGANFK